MLLLLALITAAQNEQYSFSRIDIAAGLSHNQVNAIIKDKNGFLWFGTMSGLNRYDGYSIKTYRNSADSNSLIDNFINNIWECPGDRLWVSSRSEVSIYDLKTEKFSRDKDVYLASLGLPAGQVNRISKDSKGRYWFIYDGGIIYHYGKKKTTRYAHIDNDNTSIDADPVTGIAEDNAGFCWLVHRNGLLEKIDPSSGSVINRTQQLQQLNKGSYNYSLFVDRDNGVWAWTGNPRGAFYFSPDGVATSFNESNSAHRLNNNLVNGITQDRSGRIWIATDHGGVNLVDKSRNFSITYLTNDPENNKSIGQNALVSLYRDDKGIIWIGTYKQGVSYFNENIVKFAHYKHRATDPQSLQYDDVNRFIEDRNGNLWIGTNGGGLIYFNRQQNTFKQYLHDPANSNSISSNVIVSLCIDHEEKLWIGTYLGGLNCFDGQRFIHYRHNDSIPNSLAEDRVWEILEDDQQHLLIGTLGKGIDLFDRNSNGFIHLPNHYTNDPASQTNFIMAFLQDRKGRLWIGSVGGIDVLDMKTNQSMHLGHSIEAGSLSNDNVFSLLEDASGRVWVGTREGLNLFDEGTQSFRHFTKADGLADNTILTMLEDNQHSIWITTPNGLCNLVMKPDAANKIFEVKNYDEVSNLQGREFNENAALKTRAGELIIGGPYGFNIINSSHTHKDQPKPVVAFTGLQVFNKTIEAGDVVNDHVILDVSITQARSISLKFKENVFSIEFAALDFSHSNNEKYAYKLEGFNKDWLYTDGRQRKATYTNLDPGTYYFKAKALNNEGQWSDERTLKITILPPFWRTPWAISLYVLAAIGILLLARKITVERTRMRFEVEQQRREADRMHAIDAMKTKFFTNVSHEFRTPLSLILSPLDKILRHTNDAAQKSQLQLVQRNAKRLLQLINQLLDFRKMEVQEFVLHRTPGDIIRFCKEISLSFTDIAEQKNIAFNVYSEFDKLETQFDKDKLEKILFNLISNAFKYTPNNGRIDVQLGVDESGNFQIIVKDNGIGIPADKQEKIFERFFQHDVPESMLNQGTGIGLAITREFVRLHKGTVQVQSEVGRGTSFIVTLPAPALGEPMVQPAGDTPLTVNAVTTVPAETTIATRSQPRAKAPTILVVEDNEDFRFYLKDNLAQQYKVLEAADGKAGWLLVKDLLPDMVVSDIMMPQLTGIELSRRIKNDPRTAHIPVILLTAMDNEETQLEGYKTGINDYLAKPFTFEILDTRIRNLLQQQKLLKKTMQRQAEINPATIAISSADEQFMQLATAAVEKNIGNADYSVEDLSRDLFMSRVAVYKRILALTKKTPVEFIRAMRIKRGAQLLQKSQMTISQVAFEVGFNNPKIFSRYFKDEFKILPSDYQKRNA